MLAIIRMKNKRVAVFMMKSLSVASTGQVALRADAHFDRSVSLEGMCCDASRSGARREAGFSITAIALNVRSFDAFVFERHQSGPSQASSENRAPKPQLFLEACKAWGQIGRSRHAECFHGSFRLTLGG